ncbi:hypothetical protein MTR67_012014 [Solanum verrucosum]|uniref:Uncharacterized protein n=1 Tax=Solanum verrucosum TaxID=315347 RepID=A0AAF0Q7V0_SOLVR|nr:hypothetical protein MTR67_012014 [Solanum verrucosum]
MVRGCSIVVPFLRGHWYKRKRILELSLFHAPSNYEKAHWSASRCPCESGLFIFSADFVILDCEVDFEVPIILGRPFHATGRALVDMERGQMKFRLNKKEVTFNVCKSIKQESDFKSVLVVSHTFGRGAEVFSKEKLGVALYTEKKRHAQKIVKRKLAPGDLVLLYKSRLCCFPGRCKSQWTGPFRVTQVSPHGVVELEKRNGTRFRANERGIKSYMENFESVNAVIEA